MSATNLKGGSMKNYRIKNSNIAFLVFDLSETEDDDVLASENHPQIKIYEKLNPRQFGNNAYLDIEKSLIENKMVMVRLHEQNENEGKELEYFDIFSSDGKEVSTYLKDKNKFFIKEGIDSFLDSQGKPIIQSTNQFLANILHNFTLSQGVVKFYLNSLRVNTLSKDEGYIKAGVLTDFVEEYNMHNFVEKIHNDRKFGMGEMGQN